MSVQIALGAPATRVASRKLGPVAGIRSPPRCERVGRLGDQHVGQHVRQMRDRREDPVVGLGRRSRRAGRRTRAAAGAAAHRARPRCQSAGSDTRWRPRTGPRGRARRRRSRLRRAGGRRRTAGRRWRRRRRAWSSRRRSRRSRGARRAARGQPGRAEPRRAPRRTRPAPARRTPRPSPPPRPARLAASAWAIASALASWPVTTAPSRSRAASADRAADQPDADDGDLQTVDSSLPASAAACWTRSA